MKALQSLAQRVRQFGLRRSATVYLAIVVGLVLASEFAIEQIAGQGAHGQGFAILNALAIAALVGVFVFFLFHGAVEDREKASAALADSEERFRSLTSLSADWFWETDAEHRISWIAGGRSMLKLFGSELAYGRRFWEIPGIVVPDAAVAAHLLALQTGASFHEFELCRPGRDGQAECHLISGEPRMDRDGRFLGYRGVGRDVTGGRRGQAALAGAKERLELALNSGALAIWHRDLANDRIFLSKGWGQLMQEPAEEQWCGVDDLLARVHDMDRDAVLMAWRRSVKGETAAFVAEIRLRTACGDWKWAAVSGQVVDRDAGGRVLRMAGTVIDIDARKRAEDALRDAEARYRYLVDLSPDGVLLESDGRIEYANRAAADILGVPRPASLVGLEPIQLVHPDDRAAVLERRRYLLAGPGQSDFRERRMLRPDGGIVMIEAASVSYLERGRLVMQTVLRPIAAQAREEMSRRGQRFRDVA